ncbi:MAG: hypothetical protein ACI89X_002003 [Planctomycetota bacterium]|jgi:uncharacterized protein YegP (UPF0339 family)
MATRFELVLEHDDTFIFQLRSKDGDIVLRGLGNDSKIMTQNELLHLRKAVKDDSHLVPHVGDDGSHFLIIKDGDGSVLARSTNTKSKPELDAQTEFIVEAIGSPMIDLTKHRSHAS